MSSECRTKILDAVAARVEARYGAETGTIGQWFRKVVRGPWQPGNKMRPACTVTDFGQRRGEKVNSDVTKSRILAFHLVLDLQENWDREEKNQDWSDRVQKIIAGIQNHKAAGGMKRLDYVQDDPFEVVLTNGASEQIWIVEFEAEYFEDYAEFG